VHVAREDSAEHQAVAPAAEPDPRLEAERGGQRGRGVEEPRVVELVPAQPSPEGEEGVRPVDVRLDVAMAGGPVEDLDLDGQRAHHRVALAVSPQRRGEVHEAAALRPHRQAAGDAARQRRAEGGVLGQAGGVLFRITAAGVERVDRRYAGVVER